jgi:hypothetical protein
MSENINYPPANPLSKENQIQKDLFPFDAFSFDDPNATASPNLTLDPSWSMSGAFKGTGTGLLTSIVDTAARLASSNPVLLKGQVGYESDTKFFKIGDGSTAYASLMYQAQRTLEAAYTPTLTGFGTPSAVSFSWTRIGNRLKVIGKFTAGTTTATEARISLPGSLSSDASLVPSIMLCGAMAINNNVAENYYCLIESGAAYITLGRQSATNSALTKMNGIAITSGNVVSVQFELPVSGWNV